MVIDGPRYSETWGDPTHQYIPRMANELASAGVIYTEFYNAGDTRTVPGHTAITTGNFQDIDNGGAELPEYPSIFQQWRKATNSDSTQAWVVTSKGKLEVLGNCTDPDWNGLYMPSTNCGGNGLGVAGGYRKDSLTFNILLDVLSTHHPKLALINFQEPDISAHGGSWANYIKGIEDTDEYAYQLWEFIEKDSYYSGKTTLIVTDDHGRHLDGQGGFTSHGDGCDGCRHINLLACGPDFKKGVITNAPREQIDIPATIARMLGFTLDNGKGEVMVELFK